jgi:hypothetical protein
MTVAPQIPQAAEPTPWHIGIVLYPYRHFYGPTDAQGFSRAVGSCVTALGEDYDVANAALIVRSVNAHAGLVKALEEVRKCLLPDWAERLIDETLAQVKP